MRESCPFISAVQALCLRENFKKILGKKALPKKNRKNANVCARWLGLEG
jgi:hypothetical protein